MSDAVPVLHINDVFPRRRDLIERFMERLLQKQAEILQLVAAKHQAEYLRMVNLVTKPETSRHDVDKK